MSAREGLLAAIASRLFDCARVVIVTHTSPDPDAYGSMCGLGLAMHALGKGVAMVNEHGALPRFAGIPGVSEVVSEAPLVSAHDLVVACDCATEQRVGDSLQDWLLQAPYLINIDHHYSNSLFGSINLVVEEASSTSEIVYDLLLRVEHLSSKPIITPEVATCLFSGIVGDTGSFRFESAKAKTFLTAQGLVERGAKPHLVAQNLFSRTTLGAVKMQAEAMSNMTLDFDGRFAQIVVTQEMLTRHGAEIADSDVLVDRGREIEGVVVCALLKQDVDMWRVSLRSRSSEVDVSTVAAAFGGGGHRPAAAFRWRKSEEELLPLLRQKVQELLSAA